MKVVMKTLDLKLKMKNSRSEVELRMKRKLGPTGTTWKNLVGKHSRVDFTDVTRYSAKSVE